MAQPTAQRRRRRLRLAIAATDNSSVGREGSPLSRRPTRAPVSAFRDGVCCSVGPGRARAHPWALAWAGPPGQDGTCWVVSHGALALVRKASCLRLPPRHELAEADGLRAFLHVVNAYRRRATLGLSEQPELAGLHV